MKRGKGKSKSEKGKGEKEKGKKKRVFKDLKDSKDLRDFKDFNDLRDSKDSKDFKELRDFRRMTTRKLENPQTRQPHLEIEAARSGRTARMVEMNAESKAAAHSGFPSMRYLL